MDRQAFLNHINNLSHKHLVLALKWANGGYTKGLGDYMKYTCVDGVTGETIKGKTALQCKVAGMLPDGSGLIVQKYGDGLAYPDAWLAIQAFIQREDATPEITPTPKTDATDTASKLTAVFAEMLNNQSPKLDESAIAKIVQKEINNSLLTVAKEAAEKAAREMAWLNSKVGNIKQILEGETS